MFGGQHVAALALTAGVAAVAVALSRRRPGTARRVGRFVAVAMLVSGLGYVVVDATAGTPWRYWLPLHLCDLVVCIGAAALWTRRPLLGEMTYFWGLAGALPAMLTPDLRLGFPDFHFVFYFLQHGFIVVSALLLASADDVHPRAWAPLRMWLWLNAMALPVGIFDYVADAMLALFDREEAVGKTFHLAAGPERQSTIEELVAIARTVFDRKPVRYVDPDLYMRWLRPVLKPLLMLVRPDVARRGGVFLPYLRSNPTFSTANTEAAIALRPPQVSEYFDRIMRYARDTDFGRQKALAERASETG